MKHYIVGISLLLAVAISFPANIVVNLTNQYDTYGNPSQRVKQSRTVTTTPGNSTTMCWRINRYGTAGTNLPLYVFVHEWGGDLDRCEQYAGTMNKQFGSVVGLMISFGSDPGGEVTNHWYWGTTSGTRSYPWAHQAVIQLINDVLSGTVSVQSAIGCTVDPNKVYLYGSSIGGTATLQLGAKHPEIFSAILGHSGWTKYYGSAGFDGTFQGMVGTRSTHHMIEGNADQLYLGLSGTDYEATDYTNLGWYFSNYRDPGFPAPYIFFMSGNQDDPPAQGDNLQPSLEAQKRGYGYNRYDGGHSTGGWICHLEWLINFKKNQSFLAFTNRNYGNNSFSSTGWFNDLYTHGWDHTTIVDQTNHYYVKLTGTGTADVTLRRLQNLTHTPGTVYNVLINGSSAGQVTADQYGLVTIPQVANAASIDLTVNGTGAEHTIDAPELEISACPNPFNPAVTISVGAYQGMPLQICIYDVSGRFVADLTSEISNGRVVWDASGMPSGIYVVRARFDSSVKTKAITLMK